MSFDWKKKNRHPHTHTHLHTPHTPTNIPKRISDLHVSKIMVNIVSLGMHHLHIVNAFHAVVHYSLIYSVFARLHLLLHFYVLRRASVIETHYCLQHSLRGGGRALTLEGGTGMCHIQDPIFRPHFSSGDPTFLISFSASETPLLFFGNNSAFQDQFWPILT